MIASFFAIVHAREKLIKSGSAVTVDNILRELGGAFSRSSVKLKLDRVTERISRPPLISRGALRYGSRSGLLSMRDKLSAMTHAEVIAELERLMIYVIPEFQLTIACLKEQMNNNLQPDPASGSQKRAGEGGESCSTTQTELAHDCLVLKLQYRNKGSNEIEIEVSGLHNECDEAIVYSRLDLTSTSRSVAANNWTELEKLLAAQAFALHQENISMQKMLKYLGTLMQEKIELHACVQELEMVINRLRSPD